MGDQGNRGGRKARLNRQRVVEGALDLIDEEGLGALSMRRLADKLGVKPMTLYSHIKNKDDLLDGVVVKVLSQVELPSTETPWDEAVRRAFRSYRRVLLSHPEVVPIIMRRPSSDAGTFLSVLDYSLGTLRRGGLSPEAALDAHRILTAFTTGMVMNEVNAPRVHQTQTPMLLWAQHFAPQQYPNVFAALPEMLKADLDLSFEAGLDLVLQGLERLRAEDRLLD